MVMFDSGNVRVKKLALIDYPNLFYDANMTMKHLDPDNVRIIKEKSLL